AVANGAAFLKDDELAQGRLPAIQRHSTERHAASGGMTSFASIVSPASGSPLAPGVRRRVEPALGMDLANVRVHTDTGANRTAAVLGAKAFTHGNHIWMGAGQSPDDVELMAHESTHVLQQRSQRTPILQRNPQEYEHPEDGATVQKNMAAEVAKGTEGHEDEEPPAITPELRAVQKGELVPHSKPPADRPAQARPRTLASASDVKTDIVEPAEPI